jgi:hypothetical protein
MEEHMTSSADQRTICDLRRQYIHALNELTIPATRYYLGRTSISAATFPRYLRSIWGDLSEGDRIVLLRDIGQWIDETEAGTYGRFWWEEFVGEVDPDA